MPFLNNKIRKELEDIFKTLEKDVTLKYFTQEVECQFCKETKELLQEMSAVSSKLKLEIFDLVNNEAEVKQFAIQRIPATVVMAEQDVGIRFYGIPSGFEFASLLEAIKLVSKGEPSLKPETKKYLATLDRDVHLQVFVTPTCPYCAPAVILAHQMAYLSPRVRADMIEATEYPHLANKYSVMGVPRTIINETEFLEGAAPEEMLIEKIQAVLKK